MNADPGKNAKPIADAADCHSRLGLAAMAIAVIRRYRGFDQQ
ncbi:MAG: hypothetical protein ACN6PJ_07160 [Achromobacter sp.]